MLKNLLLLFVSTIISFGLLEGALRVIMPERLAVVPTVLNNDTTYVPNQHQRFRHLEWDYETRINADGFRNDKILTEVPAGTVLALGDSFTEGHGVALADAYPKRLERLSEGVGAGTHVYNAGHYDTGLPSYRRVYRQVFRGNTKIGRVLIGVFIGNDMVKSANPADGRLQVGNEFGDSWKYRLKVFLASNVATYAALNYVVKTNPRFDALCKKLGACASTLAPNIYARDVIDSFVPHTVTFLREFVDEIRADGRRVLVVIIPTREQVDDALWEKVVSEYGGKSAVQRFGMNERLTRELRTAGIELIDLTEVAVRYQRETGEKLYFRYDGHWNPKGHQVAAAAIAAFTDTRSAETE